MQPGVFYKPDNTDSEALDSSRETDNSHLSPEPHSSQNGSSNTFNLYSGFDEIIGNSGDGDDPKRDESSSGVSEHDISSHLKGALSFGLPLKGVDRDARAYKENPKSMIGLSSKGKSTGSGILVHRPNFQRKKEIKKIERKEVEKPNLDHLSEALQLGYKILTDLMSDSLRGFNGPFMDPINLDPSCNKEYLQVIEKPIWLLKIKQNLLESEYRDIKELIADIRLMLENAYRYYGPVHSYSKKGLRIEFILEQKLALLPNEIKELCTLEKTNGITQEEQKQIQNKAGRKSSNDSHFSCIFHRVRGCRQARDKEMKRRRMELIKQAKMNKELEIIHWEEELLLPHLPQMKAMWEIPQIGQFVCLSLPVLNISEIAQYEIERALLIPQASSSLKMLMTSLLSPPLQRSKIGEKPYMPYSIWARKLANKTCSWYRIYQKEGRDAKKVFDQHGIEPMFWKVCGEQNPFKKRLFHEMTFYQRIWLLKTLCDFIGHNHKSVQDFIMEQPEEILRQEILGVDKEEKEYIYFPQFIKSDLRIYKRTRYVYTPEDDILQIPKTRERRVFSNDQIKSFKTFLRNLKRKKSKDDDDWEKYQGRSRKRRKKKHQQRPRVAATTSSQEVRSRPSRLRQRPKTRYNEENYMSDSPIPSTSEESSSDENKEDGSPQEYTPKRSPVKKSRIRSRKPTCKVCNKSFASRLSLGGHMAVHTKEKKSDSARSSREGTPNGKALLKEKMELASITENEIQSKVDTSTTTGIKEETTDNNSAVKEENVKVEIKTETNGSGIKEEKIKMEKDVKVEINGGVKEEVKEPLIKDCDETCDNESIKVDLSKDTEGNKPSLDVNTKSSVETQSELKKGDEYKDAIVENGEIKENFENRSSASPSINANEPREEEEDAFENEILPELSEFELIVSTMDELKSLILKFGPLPEKSYQKECKSLEEKDDAMNAEDDVPKDGELIRQEMEDYDCEVELHKAFCSLFLQLTPVDGKLKTAQRQLRKKLYHEQQEWSKRSASFVDPAEEAWLSEPEPEPSPLPQEPKPPTSSSSSEDEYTEDGIRKRKLRKRKAKKLTPIVDDVASFISQNDEDSDTVTVSSRGRVRKIKKIVNYDTLDFDKLARQAEKEAMQERERKKKKKEEETSEKELKVAAENLNIPSSNVRRYILSKSGEVVGYISTDGQVHSGVMNAAKKTDPETTSPLQKQRPIKKTYSSSPSTPLSTPIKMDSKMIPTILLAASNPKGNLVYVKIVGQQAIHLGKMLRQSRGLPPHPIKLQRADQTYMFSTDTKVYTRNIPGYPNYDIPTSPVTPKGKGVQESPNKSEAKTEPIKTATSPLKTEISSGVVSNCETTSLVVSKCEKTVPIQPVNTIALAYQGIPGLHSKLTTTSNSIPQPSTSCASLTASTQLVSASPSVVPSVTPFSYSTARASNSILYSPNSKTAVNNPVQKTLVSANSSVPTVSPQQSNQPVIIQGNNGQMHILNKQLNQKLVAVPNGKGGYTLSLLTGNIENTKRQVLSISSASTSTTSVNSSSTMTALHSPEKSPSKYLSTQKSIISGQQFQPRLAQQNITTPQSSFNKPFQQTTVVNKVKTEQNALRSPNQFIQIDNSGLIQQQPPQPGQPQQILVQQQQQQPRIMQLVQQSGNRQLIQLIQPMAVQESASAKTIFSTNNTVKVSQNTPQTGYIVQSPAASSKNQQTVVQQRSGMIFQSANQPTKVMQLKPEHIVQQALASAQIISQPVIIHQPQSHNIIIQQPSSVSGVQNQTGHNPQGQTVIIQQTPQLNQSQTVVLQSPQLGQNSQQVIMQQNPGEVLQQTSDITSPVQNVLMQQIPHNIGSSVMVQQSPNVINTQDVHAQINCSVHQNVINTPQEVHAQIGSLSLHQEQTNAAVFLQQATPAVSQQLQQQPFTQQVVVTSHATAASPTVATSSTGASVSRPGRIIVLQTNEGQKVFYQSPEGKMAPLTNEQIQPLIKNGTIKINP